MLVTLVVAVCVAWWVDRSRLALEIEKLQPVYFVDWGTVP
jgi:hypothetical protein